MKICYIVDSSEEKKMGLFYAVHNLSLIHI